MSTFAAAPASRWAGPACAIGFGAIIPGEPLHLVQLAGAALVLTGVLLVTLKARPPAAVAKP